MEGVSHVSDIRIALRPRVEKMDWKSRKWERILCALTCAILSVD